MPDEREERAYRFGPLERRGTVGGLRLGQAVTIGGGCVLSVLLLRVLPGSQAMPAAVLVLLIAGAAAILPISGRKDSRRVAPSRRRHVHRASARRAQVSGAASKPGLHERSRRRGPQATAGDAAGAARLPPAQRPSRRRQRAGKCSRTQSWARTRPSSSCTHAPSACSLRPSMSDVSSSGVRSLLPWRAGAPQSVVSRSSSTPRPLTVTFDSQQPSVEGGARRCNSRNLRAKPSSRERPAHAAITPRGSPPDRAETPKCSCGRRGPPRLSGRPGT